MEERFGILDMHYKNMFLNDTVCYFILRIFFPFNCYVFYFHINLDVFIPRKQAGIGRGYFFNPS